MKTLYIVRHAKSSWEEDVEDHQRALTERGRLDSILMSNYIASGFKVPDLILSSTAVRALTTAQQFKKAFNLPDANFKADDYLYDFSGDHFLKTIEKTPDYINILMVFGHNYGFTHLVNKLGNKFINNLPTCGFVQITFETNTWENLSGGKTITTLFPKDLK